MTKILNETNLEKCLEIFKPFIFKIYGLVCFQDSDIRISDFRKF